MYHTLLCWPGAEEPAGKKAYATNVIAKCSVGCREMRASTVSSCMVFHILALGARGPAHTRPRLHPISSVTFLTSGSTGSPLPCSPCWSAGERNLPGQPTQKGNLESAWQSHKQLFAVRGLKMQIGSEAGMQNTFQVSTTLVYSCQHSKTLCESAF